MPLLPASSPCHDLLHPDPDRGDEAHSGDDDAAAFHCCSLRV